MSNDSSTVVLELVLSFTFLVIRRHLIFSALYKQKCETVKIILFLKTRHKIRVNVVFYGNIWRLVSFSHR